MSNVVAIIGRPNVGKSTLFNRLTESRAAIVDPTSGVTRDRHYGRAEWNGKDFSLIDTGGYVYGSDDVFEEAINRQVKAAIEECDILMFVLDVETGITDLDDAVAKLIRKSGKPYVVVINKSDNNKRANDISDFYSLGLGDVFPVSAINGAGTGEMLDELVKHVKIVKKIEDDIPKITIVGQPNVGKSSLMNALIGEERAIVTPVAGTTRDSIYTRYKSFGFDFYLVDTAGIRKKKRVREDLEFYSVLRTIKAVEESDVCIFMIDAVEGITSQDLNIFHLINSNRKGVVILINKWDLYEKDTMSTKNYTDYLKKRLEPFTDVPILFTSVTSKQRIHKALETAIDVFNNRKQRIPTSQLNKIMLPFIEINQPPAMKGKLISIKYITQLPGRTPMFGFFTNHPQYIKENYKRYLENKLREHFKLSGVPIEVFFRSSKATKGEKEY
ncbi:MAG: ribosome biogenesis GTPase Der [Bacteroidetes bacterium]|nr:ribosome biogenesis GTPase Der [Bacteroidota bacterium]